MALPLRAALLVLLVVSASIAFAGCTGGDKTPKTVDEDAPPPPAEEAVATEDTGSVRGQLLTEDLEPVVNARVTLLTGANNTTGPLLQVTDVQGRFTFNALEPGRYRLYVAPVCCVQVLQDVVVQAGLVSDVNLLLERIIYIPPYMEEDDWTGFLSCTVGVVDCGVNDANNAPTHDFTLRPGLVTLVVGMDWDPTSKPLRVVTERRQAPANNHIYLDMTGTPPLVGQISNENVTNGEANFDNITADGVAVRFRVSGAALDYTYQQPFTVYWQMWFHGHAPPDADPIPDG